MLTHLTEQVLHLKLEIIELKKLTTPAFQDNFQSGPLQPNTPPPTEQFPNFRIQVKSPISKPATDHTTLQEGKKLKTQLLQNKALKISKNWQALKKILIMNNSQIILQTRKHCMTNISLRLRKINQHFQHHATMTPPTQKEVGPSLLQAFLFPSQIPSGMAQSIPSYHTWRFLVNSQIS